jgi:hypothetical protein
VTDKQKERLAHIRRVAPKVVDIFERVYTAEGRGRMGDMVRAKCLACCGYQRVEAAACEVETCSLHKANPYRKAMLRRQARREMES